MTNAAASLAYTVVFGIPLPIFFGMLTIICLFVTAVLGYLVLKGKYQVPFSWHMRMAGVTMVCAVIHVTLIYLQRWA
ncbi:MAG: hypothetical protein GYA23_00780 [Methanomicrobiales archaeon]|nr:hypothetical protein [Methanomicrobiales archaeon]